MRVRFFHIKTLLSNPILFSNHIFFFLLSNLFLSQRFDKVDCFILDHKLRRRLKITTTTKMTGLYVSLFISNFSKGASFLSPTFDNVSSNNIVPTPVEKVVSLVSRTGRDLQRYNSTGFRQVVGCVPYRYKKDGGGEIEVLLISAQKKGKGMLLPKGGWEIDESMEEAALRETIEEAGVTGQLEEPLGKWQYKSKRHSMIHDGYMFPMLVSQQFERWPESQFRQREWVSLSEAMELCQNSWMREALEAFINRKCQEQ